MKTNQSTMLCLSMEQAAEAIGVSKSYLFQLKQKDKRFPSLSIGRRTVVPMEALNEYINLLMEEQKNEK